MLAVSFTVCVISAGYLLDKKLRIVIQSIPLVEFACKKFVTQYYCNNNCLRKNGINTNYICIKVYVHMLVLNPKQSVARIVTGC